MKELNPIGVENLCNAIVARAAEDYADAYMGIGYDFKTPEMIIDECERFFGSNWYSALTEIDGGWLMKQVKLRELDKAIDSLSRMVAEGGSVVCKVHKTKEKEGMTYHIPPRLLPEFYKTCRETIKQLKAEKKKVMEE